jgi:uncharacterized spore protein YtfJ
LHAIASEVFPVNPQELIGRVQESLVAKRVYGEPLRVGNTTILPAAVVRGGGGGGGGAKTGDAHEGGGGFGLNVRPTGVFAVRDDGRVSWHPAVDVNRVILGGQLVAAIALFVMRPVIRQYFARRAA